MANNERISVLMDGETSEGQLVEVCAARFIAAGDLESLPPDWRRLA